MPSLSKGKSSFPAKFCSSGNHLRAQSDHIPEPMMTLRSHCSHPSPIFLPTGLPGTPRLPSPCHATSVPDPNPLSPGGCGNKQAPAANASHIIPSGKSQAAHRFLGKAGGQWGTGLGRAGREGSAGQTCFVGFTFSLLEVPTGYASQGGQGWGAQPSCRGGLGRGETLRTRLWVKGENN